MNFNEFEKHWEDLKDNFGEKKLSNKDFIFKSLKSWPIEKFAYVIKNLIMAPKAPVLRNFEDVGKTWNNPCVKPNFELSEDEQKDNLIADKVLKNIDPTEKQRIYNLIEPYRPPSVPKDSKWFFIFPARIFTKPDADNNFKKFTEGLPRFRELIDGKWIETKKHSEHDLNMM